MKTINQEKVLTLLSCFFIFKTHRD